MINTLAAIDASIEAELAEARIDAAKSMERAVACYGRVAELEAIRDLRRELGARITATTTPKLEVA